jgi:hypothetical protein
MPQVKDPARRATAAEILSHPWLAGAASSEPLRTDVLRCMRSFATANVLKKRALQVGTAAAAAWRLRVASQPVRPVMPICPPCCSHLRQPTNKGLASHPVVRP